MPKPPACFAPEIGRMHCPKGLPTLWRNRETTGQAAQRACHGTRAGGTSGNAKRYLKIVWNFFRIFKVYFRGENKVKPFIKSIMYQFFVEF
jgi:hypothetical protein